MELYHSAEPANDQSLDRHSSSDYNNAFVTFQAPPPPAFKIAAEKVKCSNKLAKNKRKTIASSDDGSKDMAYAQSVSVLAKGLKEPLAFSLESN